MCCRCENLLRVDPHCGPTLPEYNYDRSLENDDHTANFHQGKKGTDYIYITFGMSNVMCVVILPVLPCDTYTYIIVINPNVITAVSMYGPESYQKESRMMMIRYGYIYIAPLSSLS